MREIPVPPPIYAIADVEALEPLTPAQAVREMAEAGIRWIQLRAKHWSDDRLYEGAASCCEALATSDARLWIDDRADLAALLPMAGVHLGQSDLPPGASRRVVGEDLWIGYSTHNGEQLRRADGDPAVDVIALGPIFATSGRESPDPVVGLERLRRARGMTAKPLVAIGGIDGDSLLRVLEAGADCAAMIGAVCGGDVATRCRRLVREVEGSAWQ